jgi:putative ABC transport system permease protein
MLSQTFQRLRTDIFFAIRALTRSRVTVAIAVLTLAVASGVNLAMIGLVDRALLSPPPHIAGAERVFTVAFERKLENGRLARMTTTSYVTFESLREHVAAATQAAAWQRVSSSAMVNGAQVPAEAMFVSGEYFHLLGARSLLGRVIQPPDDAPPAGAAVAVLSHSFWTSAFGRDRAVLGRHFSVRGSDYTVVGVMPAGFSGHSTARADVWVPFHAAMQSSPGWDREQFRNFASIIVRLGHEQTPSAASAQASAGLDDRARRVILSSIVGAEVAGTEQRIAYWLTGISVLVLIIGLANAAILLLVRGASRRRELAIRTALGASRGRLFSHLLIESAILGLSAVGVALTLAFWLSDTVRAVLLPAMSRGEGFTSRTIAAAALAGVLAMLVACAAGAAHMPGSFRNVDSAESVRARPRRRVYTALLVLQTTLSVLLIAGAGLFGRSLYNLVSQDFGMRTKDVLLVEFERGPGANHLDRQQWISALDRVQQLAGVEAATVVQQIPFTGFHVIPIAVPGLAEPPNVNGQLPYLLAATPQLFDILDVRIIAGRRFVDADDRGAPVVIVNETMAKTTWPGESAIGKCFRIGFEPSFNPFAGTGPPPPLTTVPCRQVVGVARDLRQRSVVPTGSEAHLMQYFVPLSQVPTGPGGGPGIQGMLLRASVSPEELAAPIREIVVNGRADVPFLHVRPYADLLERQMRPWRLGTALLALFGALALGVAAVGLYAAFAHSVAERRRELAIRLAIGARSGGVLTMVLREAALIAAAGVLLGAVVAAAAGRTMQSMLLGIAPSDPLVLVAAGVVMVGVAAAATFIPARTASRTDPSSLLRSE